MTTGRVDQVFVTVVMVLCVAFLAILMYAGIVAALVAAFALCFLYVSTVHPRVALAAWVIACAFIPFWVGISSPFYLPPTSIVGVAVLGACFYQNIWRPNKLDAGVLLFCALCFAAGIAGIARQGDVTNVLTQWLLSYVVGRMLVQRTGINFAFVLIGVTFGLVAVLATVEFFADWNPYYLWVMDNAQFEAWGRPQGRGGIVRSEWAFGHSIALGCSLAMAIPIVAGTNFGPRSKNLLYVLLLAGIVVSFSRSGGITAILAVGLVIFAFKDRLRNRGRFLTLGVAIAIAAIAVPSISRVFETEGRLATVSSDYRLTLNELIPTMNALGLAKGYTEPKAGEFYFGGFKSIDSTFILLGVSFGYIIASMALIGAAFLVVRVLRGTVSSTALALTSVLPALFTVALITQFGSFVWFVLGICSLETFSRWSIDSHMQTPTTFDPAIPEKLTPLIRVEK